MDLRYPQGYDKMEIYVPCLSITINCKETHKSLLDFPERLTVK